VRSLGAKKADKRPIVANPERVEQHGADFSWKVGVCLRVSNGKANTMNTSKVVRFHKSGGPEVLEIEEIPIEAPRTGEVLLKVQTIGLNFRVAFLQERVGFAKLLEISKNRFHLAGQIRSLDVDIEHGIH
jgi:hypothetical protein